VMVRPKCGSQLAGPLESAAAAEEPDTAAELSLFAHSPNGRPSSNNLCVSVDVAQGRTRPRNCFLAGVCFELPAAVRSPICACRTLTGDAAVGVGHASDAVRSACSGACRPFFPPIRLCVDFLKKCNGATGVKARMLSLAGALPPRRRGRPPRPPRRRAPPDGGGGSRGNGRARARHWAPGRAGARGRRPAAAAVGHWSAPEPAARRGRRRAR